MPWHDVKQPEETPYYEGAPTKRTPIKGINLFITIYLIIISWWTSV